MIYHKMYVVYRTANARMVLMHVHLRFALSVNLMFLTIRRRNYMRVHHTH